MFLSGEPRAYKTIKTHLRNYQKSLSKVDGSRLCRVTAPFCIEQVFERRNRREFLTSNQKLKTSSISTCSDHYSNVSVRAALIKSCVPNLGDHMLHSMGNMTCVIPGKLFSNSEHIPLGFQTITGK